MQTRTCLGAKYSFLVLLLLLGFPVACGQSDAEIENTQLQKETDAAGNQLSCGPEDGCGTTIEEEINRLSHCTADDECIQTNIGHSQCGSPIVCGVPLNKDENFDTLDRLLDEFENGLDHLLIPCPMCIEDPVKCVEARCVFVEA